MIIVCGNQKGGVGKTMLAVNISAVLAQQNKDVLLLDTDTQTSATVWWQDRKLNFPDAPRIRNMSKNGDLADTLEDLNQRYSYVVVDIAGRGDSDELLSSMQVADILMIPFTPSPTDINTVHVMDRIVKNVKRTNKALKAYTCLNIARTNPALQREIQAAREALLGYPELDLIQTIIYDRVCYRDGFGIGLGVTEMDGRSDSDAAARREISSLVDALL
jgi:chromosome partitioning protein